MSLVHCEIHDRDFETHETPMCIACFTEYADTLIATDPTSFESIQPKESYEDLARQVVELKGKLRTTTLYIRYLADVKEYPGQYPMALIHSNHQKPLLLKKSQEKDLTGSSDL